MKLKLREEKNWWKKLIDSGDNYRRPFCYSVRLEEASGALIADRVDGGGGGGKGRDDSMTAPMKLNLVSAHARLFSTQLF